MLVSKFAKDNLKVLTTDSSVQQAYELMDRWGVDILPVIEEETGKLKGEVFRSELDDIEDMSTRLAEVEVKEKISIREDKHIFEAMRLMLKHEVRLLPVVDTDKLYSGIIRKQEVLEALSGLLNLSELGSILTIEMEQYDFTLSKLVELIETEGAKILGLAVETPTGQDNKFRISIKLNTRKTGNITAALRRFGYHVTTNTDNDYTEIDYKARASELLHYIDM